MNVFLSDVVRSMQEIPQETSSSSLGTTLSRVFPVYVDTWEIQLANSETCPKIKMKAKIKIGKESKHCGLPQYSPLSLSRFV